MLYFMPTDTADQTEGLNVPNIIIFNVRILVTVLRSVNDARIFESGGGGHHHSCLVSTDRLMVEKMV